MSRTEKCSGHVDVMFCCDDCHVSTVKPARTLGRKYLFAAVIKLRSCQPVCYLEWDRAVMSRVQTEDYSTSMTSSLICGIPFHTHTVLWKPRPDWTSQLVWRKCPILRSGQIQDQFLNLTFCLFDAMTPPNKEGSLSDFKTIYQALYLSASGGRILDFDETHIFQSIQWHELVT